MRSLALLSGLMIWRCPELWCRLAAVAPIRPLAWKPPYALVGALKRQKKSGSLMREITLSMDRIRSVSKGKRVAPEYGVVSFYGLGNLIG